MAPVIIGLLNDTGTPGDGITADPNPQLRGTATPGTLVRLMLGNTQIGSATADAEGNWQALANIIGEQDVLLVARGPDGDSAPFRLAVDQSAPAAPVPTGFAGDTTGNRSQPVWQTVDTTPAVSGTAEAGAVIRAYDGTRLLATTTADGTGAWQLALGTLPLGQYYAIGLDAEDGAGNVSARATLDLRVGETTLPVVTAVAGPAAGNYQAGQTLDITIQFNKPVVVATPPGGAGPVLEVLVGDQVLAASHVASPAPHRLTFRLTLPAGASDQDGIALGQIVQAGGTIKDSSNNPLSGGLVGVPDLSGVLVRADLAPPALTGITGPAPGNHPAGDMLVFALAFDEAVQLQLGAPAPVLEVVIGGTTLQAALLGHPAANKLSFGLVVEAEAKAQAGIALGRLIGGGAITDKVGNVWSGALGTVPDFSNVLVQADNTPPAIQAAVPRSPGPVGLGGSLVIDLQMSEAVAVAGGKPAPVLNLSIGGQAMQATLLAGTDPTVLRFALAMPDGRQGLGATVTGLSDPGGAVTDLAGNVLAPALPVSPGLAALLIDTVAPTASLIAPADGRYIPGQLLRFALSASEAMHLADGQTLPSLLIDAGGTARHASFDPFRSTPTSLAFTFRVQEGDLARGGIRVTALEDPEQRLQDAAGNPLHLTLPGTTLGVSLWPADQAPPTFRHLDGMAHGGAIDLALVFSEAIRLAGGTPVLNLMVDGTPMQAAFGAGSDGPRLPFHLDLPEGTAPQTILLTGLDLGGGQLTDLAGNAWGGTGIPAGAAVHPGAGAGGAGDDLYLVGSRGPLPQEAADGGHDTVVSTVSIALPAHLEALVLAAGAGAINGSGNAAANAITGNESANFLSSGAGDDTLAGGAGPDRLAGGAGDDVLDGASSLGEADWLSGGPGDDAYRIDTPGDVVLEASGGGRDTVFAAIPGGGYTLAAHLESLVLLGTTRTGQGNGLANAVTGNGGANWLNGAAGNDTLDGGPGHDVLLGGVGADLFLFARGSGADRIGDFTPGIDHIRLAGFGPGSFTDVLAAMADQPGGAMIDLGGGDGITLAGVQKSALSAADFLFA
ncbi:hypothetical protein JMJ56_11375 [Belnapia sp. T18]|uniref:Bacterial Ig-like domain-containing protein n=1 Tax=Belnapia arida TaxID=2804533 RepID=A0ABS1U3S7_9PROT|nr:Ig-like domain-containing protein [Belnapia arida]MBL6078609.1 hypothetical protein [Belnapia arida]